MPINPPQNNPVPRSTVRDIITDALLEIGAIAPGEALAPEDASTGLRKLQRLLDGWNARQLYAYNVTFVKFTLLANHAPHTIGPIGADFVVAQRPVEIVAANLLLNGIRLPLEIRDDAWWANEARIPGLGSTLATNLYYSPDWPNGSLYFWPVPSQVNDVELEVRTLLSQATSLNDPVSLPPGYWDALVYSLAVHLLPSYEKPANPALVTLAQNAVRTIQGNNAGSPRMSTQVAGMPGGESPGRWNWLTGGLK